MKKNGFTLIELIGVVAIIALVMVITVPQVMSTMTKSSVKEFETFTHDLELSASSYVENNWNEFKIEYQKNNKDGLYCLPLKTLMNNNYIKNTEIDPSTKQVIDVQNKYILLKNISENTGAYRFSFEYVDTASDNTVICASWEV